MVLLRGLFLLLLDDSGSLIKVLSTLPERGNVLLEVLELSLHLGKIGRTLLSASHSLSNDVIGQLAFGQALAILASLLELQRVILDQRGV